MSEVSFPVVNKPLSEDQWKSIAMGFGQGIIDRGGWPYLLTNRDNVTNEITIGVDQGTGRNEAILGGFVHRIDHAKTLPIPPVANTTTYEVGLVYDPLNHGTEAGPIKLDVWTAPGDYSQGKLRLILYRITRSPSQTLTAATVVEWRQRISTQIAVSNVSDLPVPETMLVDTIALVRNGNKWYRSHKDIDTGVVSWTQVTDNSALDSATWEPIPDTLMKRHSNGSVHAEVGTGGKSLITKDYYWENGTGSALLPDAANKMVKRGLDGNFLVPEPVNVSHPATKQYVDNHNWDGADITSGYVPAARVRYSQWAYSQAWGGTGTVRTVHVTNGYELCFYSSTRRHKTNVRPLDIDPRDALAVEPVEFDRLDPETLEPTGTHDLGVIAEQGGEHLPMFVQYTEEPDEDGNPVVEGWDYFRWTTAHQVVLRWQTRRVDAVIEAVRRVADQTGVDLSDLLTDIEE